VGSLTISFVIDRDLRRPSTSFASDIWLQPPKWLDQAKRPRALQKSIDRRKRSGDSKCQNEPRMAILERVENQHGRNGKKAKERKRIHLALQARLIWSPEH
jgi:hypothetical protein